MLFIVTNKEHEMGYAAFQNRNTYGPRKGLEGPFQYPNGRVLYYDAKEGKYYDPTTDYYVEQDEVMELQMQIFNALADTNTDRRLTTF